MLIVLGFLFPKHTLKDTLGNLVPNKIESQGNFYFQKKKGKKKLLVNHIIDRPGVAGAVLQTAL